MIALPMQTLVGTPVAANAANAAPVCAVRLINRRTGMVHRINGAPLVMFTRTPQDATQDLLRNRDATEWGVLVETLTPQAGLS